MMLKAFDAIATLSGRTSVAPHSRAGCAVGIRRRNAESVIPRQVDSGAQLELPNTRESAIVRSMPNVDTLPTDIVALHAMIMAERATHAAAQSAIIAERDRLAASNARLEAAHARLAEIIAEMKRARFGRKSERISDEQLALALEELEIAAAKVEAQVEKESPEKKAATARRRLSNAGPMVRVAGVGAGPASETRHTCCRWGPHRAGPRDVCCRRRASVADGQWILVEICLSQSPAHEAVARDNQGETQRQSG